MDFGFRRRVGQFPWRVYIEGDSTIGPFWAKGECRDGQEVFGVGMTREAAIANAVSQIKALHGEDVRVTIVR